MLDGLAAAFGSGRIVDGITALIVAEALCLLIWHCTRGGGPAPAKFLPNLAAGLALVLALRAALTHASWPWIALALAASGVAHAIDLRMRLRRRP